MSVQPLGLPPHLAVIFFWGVLLGVWGLFFPTAIGAVGAAGLSALYLALAHFPFKASGIWGPAF